MLHVAVKDGYNHARMDYVQHNVVMVLRLVQNSVMTVM